jgi:hypothetical protein
MNLRDQIGLTRTTLQSRSPIPALSGIVEYDHAVAVQFLGGQLHDIVAREPGTAY